MPNLLNQKYNFNGTMFMRFTKDQNFSGPQEEEKCSTTEFPWKNKYINQWVPRAGWFIRLDKFSYNCKVETFLWSLVFSILSISWAKHQQFRNVERGWSISVRTSKLMNWLSSNGSLQKECDKLTSKIKLAVASFWIWN